MYLQAVNDDPASTQQPCTAQVNSRIYIKDVHSGEVFTFFLVTSEDHDARNGKISIQTSLGTALIGKGVGDVVAWRAPSGLRRFEVQSVL
jgi:transcription elongation GreA/GreB family factor